MGVVDAPQWLLPAFVRSAKAVGASAPEEQLRLAGERLVTMWTSADRCFHNLKHAIDMLARVDELADESHNPDVMRLAVWYHGCVFSSAHEETYRRNGGEDEIASAVYAAEDLQALGVPDKVTDRICALILNLKRHNLPSDDIDAMALNDADLGTLAVEPQLYKRYREQVRAEYAHIPQADYLRARLAIVSRLLGRDVLFHSPMGSRWELPARQNLEAELRRLTDELSALDDAPAGADGASAPDSTACAPSAAANVPANAAPQTPVATGAAVPTLPTVPAGATSAAPATGAPATGAEPAQANAPTSGGAPAAPAHAVTRVSVMARNSAAPRVSVAVRRTGRPDTGTATAPAAAPAASAAQPAAPGASSEAAEREELAHTTTMESCAEDLDLLMASPRTSLAPTADTAASAAPAAITGEVPAVDRRSAAEAERLRLAECARQRAEEAKVAREARTGEIQVIPQPVVDDGADGL